MACGPTHGHGPLNLNLNFSLEDGILFQLRVCEIHWQVTSLPLAVSHEPGGTVTAHGRHGNRDRAFPQRARAAAAAAAASLQRPADC